MSSSEVSSGIGPILDSTLRDGRYLGNWEPEVTSSLVAELADCGIAAIEIGPELGLGDTSTARFSSRDLIFQDIASASNAKSTSLIGCFFIPGIGNHEDLVRARDSGLDFVRVGQNPSNWSSALEYIELSKTLGLRVFFNIMKSHLLSPAQFAEIARQISDVPIDGLYLVDSTGTLTPDEVKTYILHAREMTEHPLGFHGHNNLGLAQANSLMAWSCGALHVDGTLAGIGRGGGNASTEILAGLLRKLKFESSINLKSLCQLPLGLTNRLNGETRESIYLDLLCGVLGFHSSFLKTLREVASCYEIPCDQLLEEVAAKNREDPSRKLIEQIARDLVSSLKD